MRPGAFSAALIWAAAAVMGQSSAPDKLSQIHDGELAAGVYTNDDLGIRFSLPHDWSANVKPQMPTLFNPQVDAPANRCTRILLEFDAKPDDSTAKGVVFAVDPDCLGMGPFPATDAVKEQLEAFNRSIFEVYRKSTFFPPSGVQLYAFKGAGAQSRLFLGMAGAVQVAPPGSDPGVRSEPVSMNTLFVLVNADKCWVGWAVVADDKAKDEFAKDSRMTVK
jgi:hypothetical protein